MTKCGWPYQGLIDEIFLPYFQKHGESAIPFLVDGQISSLAFLSAYRFINPIETMPEKEKKEMKQYVIELFPEKTTEQKLQACKIIYTIGSII